MGGFFLISKNKERPVFSSKVSCHSLRATQIVTGSCNITIDGFKYIYIGEMNTKGQAHGHGVAMRKGLLKNRAGWKYKGTFLCN